MSGSSELVRVADNDGVDFAFAGEQHADLPVRLVAELDEVARELGAHDVVGRDAAPEGVAQVLQLTRLEAEGVA